MVDPGLSVKLLELPFLADENIDPGVVDDLKALGVDIQTVHEHDLRGATDRAILRAAHQSGRVVLTHDSDFGGLALRDGEPVTGIVYLRPGHISSRFVIAMLDAANSVELPTEAAFVIVVEQRAGEIRIRIRELA